MLRLHQTEFRFRFVSWRVVVSGLRAGFSHFVSFPLRFIIITQFHPPLRNKELFS